MESIKEAVREKYAQAAREVTVGAKAPCCGSGRRAADPITSDLYGNETAGLPAEAMLASLGCGNPTLLAQLYKGDTVLDLGSGGGIDVLLSARRVGPSGKAYGLDMTDEMLALANENKAKAGAENVEFLKGDIENIPLPDDSVDVIISNCVINLSADKPRVLREAFRVLKPGGRFAVADVVRRGSIPEAVARSVELWAGCVAGALEVEEYKRLLAAAGFTDVDVEPTRVYGLADARAFVKQSRIDPQTLPREIDGAFMSAFIRAVKP
jgi:arsenite methyltransferase